MALVIIVLLPVLIVLGLERMIVAVAWQEDI
jgi:hypothetical protein